MRSRLPRLGFCLIALCIAGSGVSAASASAANTIAVTAPSTANVWTQSTVTASGHTDAQTYVRVFSYRNGSACPDSPDTSDPDTQQLSPGPYNVAGPADYSRTFTFYPPSAGTYVLCGYLTGSPDVKSEPKVVMVSAALPQVTTTSADQVAGVAATLRGSVNPGSESADWHFEYGKTDAYGAVTPTQTQPANAQNGAVAADVSLEPSTTYHYRVVASNSGGTVEGQDSTFTTAPASSMTMSVPSFRWAEESWPITLSGTAGSASYYAAYLEPNGGSCAATDSAQASRPGVTLAMNGSVAAGQFSVGAPMQEVYQQPAGTYLVCAYLLANNRRQGPSEASASGGPVTVSHHACPSLDFSVTGASTQSGTSATFDAVLPGDAAGNIVRIVSSDGGGYTEEEGEGSGGEIYATQGGPRAVSTPLNYRNTIVPSYSRPVTVTFTITYMAFSPFQQCIHPDGTVVNGGRSADGYPAIRTSPKTFTVTFRNQGTPPPDPASHGESPIEGDGEQIGGAAAALVKDAIGDALTPSGKAGKIGAILKKGYKEKFTSKQAGKVKGVWYFVPKGARVAARAKPVVIASGSTTVKKGSNVLKLRLTKAGKAKLRKARTIKLTTKGTFTSTAGQKLAVKRSVKLKR